ncbi:MAG: NAD-dependent deacetylase [Hyphomicrobiaceae bacterium]|nr:MAG: NAD-dependent deacetylase [Hyphomicrobiaceae bacterium]
MYSRSLSVSHGAKIEALRDMLATSERGIAFTGAGISTECGIPDFRGKDGLWTRNAPIDYRDFLADPNMRREAWRRKKEIEPVFRAARPGSGHRAIASLIANGHFSHVITQNIDNLHQASGVPADRIIELHGNGSYARCLACGERHEIDWVFERLAPDHTPPGCRSCGGIIKTATISFGQAMPAAEMARATEVAAKADLFLALGSSLVVYPAAGLPLLAKQSRARLVIVNREPTEMDDIADLVIHGDIRDVLGSAVQLYNL